LCDGSAQSEVLPMSQEVVLQPCKAGVVSASHCNLKIAWLWTGVLSHNLTDPHPRSAISELHPPPR